MTTGSKPSAAMELRAIRAQEYADQSDVGRSIMHFVDHIAGLATLSVVGVGFVLATAPDRPSLYRRAAILGGAAGLGAIALGLSSVLRRNPADGPPKPLHIGE